MFEARLSKAGVGPRTNTFNEMSRENDFEEKLIHNTYLNGLSVKGSGLNKSIDEGRRAVTPNHSSPSSKKINWADNNNINRRDLLCSTNLTKELFYQKDIKPIMAHKKSKPVKGILKKKDNFIKNEESKLKRPNSTNHSNNALNNSSLVNTSGYNTNYSSINVNNSNKTTNNFYTGSNALNNNQINNLSNKFINQNELKQNSAISNSNSNAQNNSSIVNNFLNSKNLNNSSLNNSGIESQKQVQIQRSGNTLTPPNRQNINQNYSSLNSKESGNQSSNNINKVIMNKSNYDSSASESTTANSRLNNFNIGGNYIGSQPPQQLNTQQRSYSLDNKPDGKNIGNSTNPNQQGETKIYISPNIQSVYNNNINNYFIQSGNENNFDKYRDSNNGPSSQMNPSYDLNNNRINERPSSYGKKETSNNTLLNQSNQNSNNVSPLNAGSKNFSYLNNNQNTNSENAIKMQQINSNSLSNPGLQRNNYIQNSSLNNNNRLLKNNDNQRLLNNNYINSNNLIE